MPGTLTLKVHEPGTVTLKYVAGTTFSSGTIHQFRSDTGAITKQAIVVGDNTFTSIPGGIRLVFWVEALNSSGALIGVTAPVILFGTVPKIGAGSPVTLSWRTDVSDFLSQIIGSDLERASVLVNMRGYWYQQRYESNAQNVRLFFSDMKLHARIHGRGQQVAT